MNGCEPLILGHSNVTSWTTQYWVLILLHHIIYCETSSNSISRINNKNLYLQCPKIGSWVTQIIRNWVDGAPIKNSVQINEDKSIKKLQSACKSRRQEQFEARLSLPGGMGKGGRHSSLQCVHMSDQRFWKYILMRIYHFEEKKKNHPKIGFQPHFAAKFYPLEQENPWK